MSQVSDHITHAAVRPAPGVAGGPLPQYVSVLFERPDETARVDPSAEPDYFRDLNLDQVVTTIIAGRDE